jgi:hypothetical protein
VKEHEKVPGVECLVEGTAGSKGPEEGRNGVVVSPKTLHLDSRAADLYIAQAVESLVRPDIAGPKEESAAPEGLRESRHEVEVSSAGHTQFFVLELLILYIDQAVEFKEGPDTAGLKGNATGREVSEESQNGDAAPDSFADTDDQDPPDASLIPLPDTEDEDLEEGQAEPMDSWSVSSPVVLPVMVSLVTLGLSSLGC